MQNVNGWVDKFGRELAVGQRVAAVKGSSLHIGEILHFNRTGVTIASENSEGEIRKIPILYKPKYGGTYQNSFYIL